MAIVGSLGIFGAIGGLLIQEFTTRGRELIETPVEVDVREITIGPNYVFPMSVDPASAPIMGFDTDESVFREWAESVGGILYNEVTLEVVVRGAAAAPTVISDISVEVRERTPIDAGWVNVWEGCGAEVPVRYISADISTSPPSTSVSVDGEPRENARFEVSSTEQETWVVSVGPWSNATWFTDPPMVYSWVLEFHYTSSGRDGVFVVDSDGQPFRTAVGGKPITYLSSWDGAPLTRDDNARESIILDGVIC